MKKIQIRIDLPTVRDLFSPVLSDRTILRMMKRGQLITSPISEAQIQPNSIDLTLAGTWSKGKPNYHNTIDVKKEIHYDEGRFKEPRNIPGFGELTPPYYTIMPGEFVLMASREVLNIPNGILAFVQGRSSMARLGIQTEQAGLIDAGFHGTITFEVYNESKEPITVYERMRVAQLYFFRAQKASMAYGPHKGSKYSGQIVATGSKIHMDPELR